MGEVKFVRVRNVDGVELEVEASGLASIFGCMCGPKPAAKAVAKPVAEPAAPKPRRGRPKRAAAATSAPATVPEAPKSEVVVAPPKKARAPRGSAPKKVTPSARILESIEQNGPAEKDWFVSACGLTNQATGVALAGLVKRGKLVVSNGKYALKPGSLAANGAAA